MTETTAAETEPTPKGDSGFGAILRLLAGIAAVVVLAALFHGLAVLVIVAALVVMVMVHELGHFVAAKVSGMKVTEYFFGFGPRLWSIRKGETEYGVKALPAGGYVRIVGMTGLEEVDPADEARSYRQATFPRRFTVAIAGSAMHFVMAFGLLWGMVAFTGLPTATSHFEITSLESFVNHSNPAAQAGIKPGDVLVSADGHHYASVNEFIAFIETHAGKRISLTVRRAGRLLTFHLRPIDGRRVEVAGGSGPVKTGKQPVGVIGVELSQSVLETTNPLSAVPRAGTLLGRAVALTATGMAAVFSPHGISTFAHQVATARTTPSGPSGSAAQSQFRQQEILSIYGAVSIAAQGLQQQGVYELLYILVIINIFVGMANLFPMLPLDGGHVAIAIYERVRSRRGRRYHADVRKLMPLAYLFLACLVLLGLGALYVNIVQPPALPH